MTDSSIATPEEMLSALERWADAKGWWLGSDTDRWFVERPTWVVRTPSAGGRLSIALGGNGLEYAVTPEWAVAWALTVEAGLPPVDVGPCKATRPNPNDKGEPDRCHHGKIQRWIGVARTSPTEWLRDGLTDCPDCSGTGRDLRDPARLVLDASPRPVTPADVWLRAAMAEAAEPPRSARTTRMLEAAARHVADGGRALVGTTVGLARYLGGHARRLDNRIRVVSLHALREAASGLRPGDARMFVDHHVAETRAGELAAMAADIARINKVEPGRDPGDPKAIEALTTLADHLQPHAFDTRDHDPTREAAGHALAHLVALWLGGDLRETKASVEALTRAWESLTVPCERCEETGRVTRYLTATAVWGRPLVASGCGLGSEHVEVRAWDGKVSQLTNG